MLRRPGTGPSKASATTLCQKCLQRGHYSYECKASAQERPYKSRPSRTQQLLNPQLKPKLTTQVPNELLRKKGVADDMLKKKDEERGRTSGRKHSRSPSSSADSVSTISTNRSPSRSPPPRRQKHERDTRGKRSRRSRSTDSRSSIDSRPSGDRDRNTRRRRSSFSPAQRGRRDAPLDTSTRELSRTRGPGKRPRRSRSRSADDMSTTSDPAQSRALPPRPTSPSQTPNTHQRSPGPFSDRRNARRSPSPRTRNRFDDGPGERRGRGGAPPVPPAPRERSLSPFSKRVALTRAMNAG
ncbi:uncharacterized protein EKO05_0007586 [Ascochyta rabiei]|nr:uncharacterized protein EKO05_0007586 [Ascochyta rabiei]UPX17219.1 hypothetical protein EKO05_0007586 [Ascochyta rabiei]